MTTNVVALPVVIPIAVALLSIFAGRSRRLQEAFSWFGSLFLLLLSLWLFQQSACNSQPLSLPIGGWTSDFGIVWIIDGLSALMILAANLLAFAFFSYVIGDLQYDAVPIPHAISNLLIAGVNGCFITGDFFNLFVFFELVLITSYVMMAYRCQGKQYEKVFAYIIVNMVAGMMFLGAVGIIYGVSGTVNMQLLFARTAELSTQPSFLLGAVTLLVVFAIKAGVFPLFFWLPDSYPQPPAAVGAYFGGILTKIGIYALIRSSPLLVALGDPARYVLLAMGGLTMFIGVVAAFGQKSIREILSFHIVSQMGYMIFGLALNTSLALAATAYFIFHQSVVKSALFFVSGIVERFRNTGDLDQLGGLARHQPIIAAAFFIPALSLAGLPPFSGFWGKLLLIKAGFEAGAWLTATVAVGTSFFTLASMLKIWGKAFWGRHSGTQTRISRFEYALGVGVPLGLASVSLMVGVMIGAILPMVESIAQNVLETQKAAQTMASNFPDGGGG